MGKQFNIVANIQLQSQSAENVAARIRRQLTGISAKVSIKLDKNTVTQLGAVEKKLVGINAALLKVNASGTAAADTMARLAGAMKSASGSLGNASGPTTNLSNNIGKVQRQANDAGKSVKNFGEQAGLAARRFIAFSVSATGIIKLSQAIKTGLTEAIAFERELVRISQVTRTSLENLQGLTSEVTRLATTLGTSSAGLIEVSRILAQTGLNATDTKTALAALAKTTLAATFTDIEQTGEGAVAIMAQFGVTAQELEGKLGSINAVAGQFAVESNDIITAVRRAGGAFEAAGGSVEELIALFTSVRSTTRESAETIATGFRTIFTRIQRPRTIAFLRELGVELQNAQGQFIGPQKAVEQLNLALKGLETTDPRFSQVIEELGGFRQVSKVIPLIQQYDKAVQALTVAKAGTNSLDRDAVVAQQSLAIQLTKVREEFTALIREVGGSSTFKNTAQVFLALASALVKVSDALVPILPLIGLFGVSKGVQFGARNLTSFTGSFFNAASGGGGGASGGGVNGTAGPSGGPQSQATSQNTASANQNTASNRNLAQQVRLLIQNIQTTSQALTTLRANIASNTNSLNQNTAALNVLTTVVRTSGRFGGGGRSNGGLPFAAGGHVPGSGSRDTVPAMLTPGEFVIRKPAAQSIGVHNLGKLNRMNKGGRVQKFQTGGQVSGGGSGLTSFILLASVAAQLSATLGRADAATQQWVDGVAQGAFAFLIINSALQGLGNAITAYSQKSNAATVANQSQAAASDRSAQASTQQAQASQQAANATKTNVTPTSKSRPLGDFVAQARNRQAFGTSKFLTRTPNVPYGPLPDNFVGNTFPQRNNSSLNTRAISRTNRALTGLGNAAGGASGALGGIATIVALASAALIAFGTQVEESGRKALDAAKTREEADAASAQILEGKRFKSIGIGAGTGAGAGAAIGAAAGSVVPVLGTAIGAIGGTVVGAIVGGLSGLVISSSKASEELQKLRAQSRNIDFKRGAAETNLAFQQIQNGAVTFERGIGIATTKLQVDARRANNENDPANREQFEQNLRGQAGLVQNNLRELLTRGSRTQVGHNIGLDSAGGGFTIDPAAIDAALGLTLDGFDGAGRKLIEIQAQLNGITFSEALVQVREQQRQLLRVAETARRASNALEVFQSAQRYVSDFADSVESANASLRHLEPSINAIVAGASGQFAQVGGLSNANPEIFSRASRGAFLESGELERAVNSVIGPRSGAKGLTDFALDTAQLSRELPDILSRAVAGSGFDADQLGTSFESELKNSGIGKEFTDLLTSRLDADLSKRGASGLGDIRAEIRNNPSQVANRLFKDADKSFLKEFERIAKTLQDSESTIAGALASRAKLEQDIANQSVEVAKSRFQAEKQLLEARGEGDTVSVRQADAALKARQSILTGGVSPTSPVLIGGELRKALREQASVQNRLSQTDLGDTDERVSLNRRFAELNNKIGNLSTALKNLTSATERSAAINDALQKEQKARDVRFNTASDIAFGGPETQFDFTRNVANTLRAATTGSIRGIRPDQREAILPFLRQFKDIAAPVFGNNADGTNRTGGQLQDVIVRDFFKQLNAEQGKEIFTDAFIKQIVDSTDKEDQLLNALKADTQAQVEAQNQIKETIVQQAELANNFIARSITENTNRLEATITRASLSRVEGQLRSTVNNRDVAQTQLNQVSKGLDKVFGVGLNDANVSGAKNFTNQFTSQDIAQISARSARAKQFSKFGFGDLDTNESGNIIGTSAAFDTTSLLRSFGSDKLANAIESQGKIIHGKFSKLGAARNEDIRAAVETAITGIVGETGVELSSTEIQSIVDDVLKRGGNAQNFLKEGPSFINNTIVTSLKGFEKTQLRDSRNKEQEVLDFARSNGLNSVVATNLFGLDEEAVSAREGLGSLTNALNGFSLERLTNDIRISSVEIGKLNTEVTFLKSTLEGINIRNQERVDADAAAAKKTNDNRASFEDDSLLRNLRDAFLGKIFDFGSVGLNKGGNVPGVGSRDTVPAMLTPGEFVINKKSTQKNFGLLSAINNGNIPRFASGGLVADIRAEAARIRDDGLTEEERKLIAEAGEDRTGPLTKLSKAQIQSNRADRALQEKLNRVPNLDDEKRKEIEQEHKARIASANSLGLTDAQILENRRQRGAESRQQLNDRANERLGLTKGTSRAGRLAFIDARRIKRRKEGFDARRAAGPGPGPAALPPDLAAKKAEVDARRNAGLADAKEKIAQERANRRGPFRVSVNDAGQQVKKFAGGIEEKTTNELIQVKKAPAGRQESAADKISRDNAELAQIRREAIKYRNLILSSRLNLRGVATFGSSPEQEARLADLAKQLRDIGEAGLAQDLVARQGAISGSVGGTGAIGGSRTSAETLTPGLLRILGNKDVPENVRRRAAAILSENNERFRQRLGSLNENRGTAESFGAITQEQAQQRRAALEEKKQAQAPKSGGFRRRSRGSAYVAPVSAKGRAVPSGPTKRNLGSGTPSVSNGNPIAVPRRGSASLRTNTSAQKVAIPETAIQRKARLARAMLDAEAAKATKPDKGPFITRINPEGFQERVYLNTGEVEVSKNEVPGAKPVIPEPEIRDTRTIAQIDAEGRRARVAVLSARGVASSEATFGRSELSTERLAQIVAELRATGQDETAEQVIELSNSFVPVPGVDAKTALLDKIRNRNRASAIGVGIDNRLPLPERDTPVPTNGFQRRRIPGRPTTGGSNSAYNVRRTPANVLPQNDKPEKVGVTQLGNPAYVSRDAALSAYRTAEGQYELVGANGFTYGRQTAREIEENGRFVPYGNVGGGANAAGAKFIVNQAKTLGIDTDKVGVTTADMTKEEQASYLSSLGYIPQAIYNRKSNTIKVGPGATPVAILHEVGHAVDAYAATRRGFKPGTAASEMEGTVQNLATKQAKSYLDDEIQKQIKGARLQGGRGARDRYKNTRLSNPEIFARIFQYGNAEVDPRIKQLRKDLTEELFPNFKPEYFATGGGVPGTGNADTVPALLTPGEFVLNKRAVAALGADNLGRFNNRFNKGGGVKSGGIQKFANGGGVESGGGFNITLDASSVSALNSFQQAASAMDSSFARFQDAANILGGGFDVFNTGAGQLASALNSFSGTLTLGGTFDVNVNVLGGVSEAGLSQIRDGVQQMVDAKVGTAIAALGENLRDGRNPGTATSPFN